MDKIVTLSNNIKLGFIGNVYPVMFEDNTIICEWDRGNPYDVEGHKTLVTAINGKTMLICDVAVELADWIKEEIRKYIMLLKTKEIDLIICNPAIIHLVYNYVSMFRSDIDLYTLDIMEGEKDDELEIARINLFLRFNPNLL